MVGVIEKRMTLLLARFKDNPQVLEILLRISTKTHTSDDIRLLTTILRQIYFTGSITGYTTQSRIVRRVITRWGQAAATEYALRKAPVVMERLVETLTAQPEYRGIVRTLIEDGAVKEAFVHGQETSAEENELLWKMWLRVRDPHTGHRREHSSLEGLIIHRTEKFTLPNGQMVDAPHDWTIPNAAREWVNCGHQILYVPAAKREDFLR